MKPFSKEWWLSMGLRFELGTCFKRSTEKQGELGAFCFEKYAEAYHREKMEKYHEDWAHNVPQRFFEIERKRILEIIEEEYKHHLKRLEHHGEWPSMMRVELLIELIEKIKGE